MNPETPERVDLQSAGALPTVPQCEGVLFSAGSRFQSLHRQQIRDKNIGNHCSCCGEEGECVEDWWWGEWYGEEGREGVREAADSCGSEWAVHWWRSTTVEASWWVDGVFPTMYLYLTLRPSCKLFEKFPCSARSSAWHCRRAALPYHFGLPPVPPTPVAPLLCPKKAPT